MARKETTAQNQLSVGKNNGSKNGNQRSDKYPVLGFLGDHLPPLQVYITKPYLKTIFF